MPPMAKMVAICYIFVNHGQRLETQDSNPKTFCRVTDGVRYSAKPSRHSRNSRDLDNGE